MLDTQKRFPFSDEVTFVSCWLAEADRTWLKNYVTKVGATFYKCTVCEAMLKQNNLKSHMQNKHPEIFETERAISFLGKKTDEVMEKSGEESEKSEDE